MADNSKPRKRQTRVWSRKELIRQLIDGQRVTSNQWQRVVELQRQQGWLTALTSTGPRNEIVAFVRRESPFSTIIIRYLNGQRNFDIGEITQQLGYSVFTRHSMRQFANAGLAVKSLHGNEIEFVAANPHLARFVNEARCSHQKRGVSAEKLAEAILRKRNPNRSRLNLTVVNRLWASEILWIDWSIRCDDILTRKNNSRVRLVSAWTMDNNLSNVA